MISTGPAAIERHLFEARHLELPERAWLIPQILPAVGLTLCTADSFGGKSTLSMQLQHYIACGREFFDLAPLDRELWRPVLVLDVDGSPRRTANMSFKLAPEDGDDFAELVHTYWSDDLPETYEERLLWLDRYLREIGSDSGQPFALVRIDTLEKFACGTRGQQENAYEWKTRIMRALQALAETHAVAILILHHTNSAGEISGGAAGTKGSCEAEWRIRRPSSEDDPFTTMTCEVRGEDPVKLAMTWRDAQYWATIEVTPAQASHSGQPRAVLDALAVRNGQTVADLVQVTGLTSANTRQQLSRLKRKGEVRKSGEQWYLCEFRRAEPVDLGGGVVDDGPPVELPPPSSDDFHLELAAEQLDGDVAEGERTWSTRSLQALKDSVTARRRRVRPVRVVPLEQRESGPWPAAVKARDGSHRWRQTLAENASLAGHDIDELEGYAVVTLDRNGSYPSACGNVPVVAEAERWRNFGGIAFDDVAKLAGMFRVVARPAPPHSPPAAGFDSLEPEWVTAPTLRLMAKAGQLETIVEAWTGPQNTSLFEPFSTWAREQRERTRGTPAYEEVKRGTSIALRMLHCSRPASPFWRPDWHKAMVAEANARHWSKALQAHHAGFPVVALRNTDEVSLLISWAQLPTGTPHITALPPACPYELGTGFGQVKVKNVMRAVEWVGGQQPG